MWAKKFKLLLEASEENTTLKARVFELEDQVGKMQHALGHVMKSYVDLARMTIDHRKGLEEVFSYLTANETVEEVDDSMIVDEPADSPEELAERKRMMN
jgi:hypothetical protein